jgi:hypothetical protein
MWVLAILRVKNIEIKIRASLMWVLAIMRVKNIEIKITASLMWVLAILRVKNIKIKIGASLMWVMLFCVLKILNPKLELVSLSRFRFLSAAGTRLPQARLARKLAALCPLYALVVRVK